MISFVWSIDFDYWFYFLVFEKKKKHKIKDLNHFVIDFQIFFFFFDHFCFQLKSIQMIFFFFLLLEKCPEIFITRKISSVTRTSPQSDLWETYATQFFRIFFLLLEILLIWLNHKLSIKNPSFENLKPKKEGKKKTRVF